MAMSYETFKYRGQIWTRHPVPKADETYLCGADLGQSMDPTAIIVLHATHAPLETWTTNEVTHTIKQDIKHRFDVVHAERMPLGTSYPDIVAHIREVLARPPLRDDCDLVIDESGVGRAVGDMFDQAGLRPIRVAITAGADATRLEGARRWSVAKSLLISGVDARLHSGELRFAAKLTEANALAEELKDFQRHLTSAGGLEQSNG
jgi:hypothetical protein